MSPVEKIIVYERSVFNEKWIFDKSKCN
jgi:hypothetical protein